MARNGELVALGPPRGRALLALLLVHANRAVERERIVDGLWGESPPTTAVNALQVAVHGVRAAIGPERIERRGTAYRLAADPEEVDLHRFETLVRRAQAQAPAEAAETLREALALHRGAFLADVDDPPYVAVERRRIEELRLAALEQRIATDLSLGRHAELVGELDGLVSAHPYRERLRAQLMLALYRAGRQAEALEQYRLARATLGDELGLDPSPELHELEAGILRQDTALAAPTPPESGRSRLPRPPRALVGRELELAAVVALVEAPGSRLVTLTGPGGIGKTRLALEAARELESSFAGGARFVDLSSLADPTLVAATAARALGVREAEGEALPDRVAAALGDQRTVLVLDNFEHVLGAAPFVAELLAAVAPLHIVATSREPLRIRAEDEYRVPTLGLPPRDAHAPLEELRRVEAVELFLARARAARPGLELTTENASAVVEICHALDGLPLALELAAARMKLLSPATLLGRLEDRLGVLAEGDRDLPDRQRTLRAAVDWSYELLAPAERTLLARLSVFAGGWTLEAAEQVCDADLDSLGSLVEKSLVQSAVTPALEPRFSMLETVRQYAVERLAASEDGDETRDRHAEHFAQLAERLEPDLHQAAALDEAEREHDNIRAALAHALSDGSPDLALRLCSVARFWYVRGFQREGRAWIDEALARPEGSPSRRAIAYYWSATLAWTGGDYESAIAPARRALELAREAGDDFVELRSLMALGLTHLGAKDLVASRDFHLQSLELARRLERDRDVALSLSNLADVEATLGNHEAAEALARESLVIGRRNGDEEATGIALLVLAASELELGRDADADPMIVESVRCFRSVDFKDFLASALVALARARAQSDPAQAARLLGASGALRAPLGPAQFPWERDWYERTDARVRALLGGAQVDAEQEAGGRMPRETIDEAC